MHVCRQVEVRGVDGELKSIAESKLSIKPNFAYTLSEVRDDIQRVFDAGYFQELTPVAEDTRDGIKLTLQARPHVREKGGVKGALGKETWGTLVLASTCLCL